MLAFTLYGGLTMFDAALAAAVVSGMLALLRAIRVGRARDWALLGMALALGGLAKGPVILIHVGPVLALAPLWSGERVSWRAMARGVGIAVSTGLLRSPSGWFQPLLRAGQNTARRSYGRKVRAGWPMPSPMPGLGGSWPHCCRRCCFPGLPFPPFGARSRGPTGATRGCGSAWSGVG